MPPKVHPREGGGGQNTEYIYIILLRSLEILLRSLAIILRSLEILLGFLAIILRSLEILFCSLEISIAFPRNNFVLSK